MRLDRRLVSLIVGATLVAGCGAPAEDRLAMRVYTEHFALRISADPRPPRAREKTQFKVVVRDKDTGQPIEGGEGIIYSNTRDGARAWDILTPAPQLGTYTATLNFVVSGEWAMGLRFRRDSTQKLEQVDWMQEVLAERAATP